MDTEYTYMETPVGRLMVAWRKRDLVSIRFGPILNDEAMPSDWILVPDAVNEATTQLRAYFDGRLREFNLPLAMEGTDFQRRVWSAVAAIPFGETRSYADVAREIGNARAVRAVGGANGRNDIPIVVPCHRVITSSGGLGGYAGGVSLKERLLVFESTGDWSGVLAG